MQKKQSKEPREFWIFENDYMSVVYSRKPQNPDDCIHVVEASELQQWKDMAGRLAEALRVYDGTAETSDHGVYARVALAEFEAFKKEKEGGG